MRAYHLLPLALFALLAPADPARIVMTRVAPQPGQLAMFIANADGTNEHPLGTAQEMNYDPAWAPDGRSIVFTSERNGSADLYRVNTDGSALERLTDNPAYDDQAAFSPDTKQLVFVSSRADGTADLFRMDLATKRVTPLTSGPGGDFRPSWSPDGKWIAFSSDRTSSLPSGKGRWEALHVVDVYIVHPDRSGLKQLTPHGGMCGSPTWSPDSKRVLMHCMTAQQTMDNRRAIPDLAEDTRIAAVDIATGAMTDLQTPHGVNLNPVLAHGDVMAFIRRDGSTQGIQYSDGTRGPAGQIRAASWSPDGKQVVFHKRIPFTRHPWAQAYSKNPQYELVLGGANSAFSADGAHLAFIGPGAVNAKGASLAVADVGRDTLRVVYRDSTRNVLGPQWTADGTHIIFGIGEFGAFFNSFHTQFGASVPRSEGGAQVAMVRADGSGYEEFTKGPANNAFPSIAPDGRRFVYRTFGDEGDGLRIMDIATRKITSIASGYDNFPLWSPRGDLIMFSRNEGGNYEIWTIHPDGTNPKQLTHSQGNDAHMSWSPDGEYIVFASARMGFKDEVTYTDAPQPYGDIFVMRFDGTNVQQLTDNQWEEGTPAWQPAGKMRKGK